MKQIIALLAALLLPALHAAEIHVAPSGNDSNPGSETKPLATLAAAQQKARGLVKREPVTVQVHAGTYYLSEALRLTAADSGCTYTAAPGEQPVISGSEPLTLDWTAFRNGIFQAKTPAGLVLDQLFVNGQLQHMARYPNYDPNAIKPKRPGPGANGDPGAPKFNGSAGDSTSTERIGRWADPAGGYVHAIQAALWGSMHYRILGKKTDGSLDLDGGWQHNRPDKGPHKDFRFVENIFEELDAPGEWFHDAKTKILYYYPPTNVDLNTAQVESVRLRHLIEFSGTREHPVKSVTLRGLKFTQSSRTFMDNKESLLRSDWTIYRGGAAFLKGAEDCSIESCDFDQLGGNAIFVSGYNRRVAVRGCFIRECGANGVAMVGEAKAVRSPMFSWGPGNPWSGGKPELPLDQIDRTPGPLTDDYPADCLVEDCLITCIGRLEKQSACVEISMAKDITIRHCSAYEVPRAAINIGDGCWGGHVVEFCDVFDTVFETGDHGSYNSWGRDRFWGTLRVIKLILEAAPGLQFADAMKPIVLRNNRWRCDYGFDIDLDDGSSNYEIYNNLMLGRGLKLREGYRRIVYNNIIVNNSLHPHCWVEGSEDVFTKNIVMRPYLPSHMGTVRWGKEIDWNLFTTSEGDRTKFAANGCDANSLVGDPMFIDPAKGDYRVQEGSPALKLGFRNFRMDQFGVTSPRLKAVARTPALPQIERKPNPAAIFRRFRDWQGAKIRDLDEMEFSALQIPEDAKGVIVAEAPTESTAYKMGLRTGDFIQGVDGRAVRKVEDLLGAVGPIASGNTMKLSLRREQQPMTLELRHP